MNLLFHCIHVSVVSSLKTDDTGFHFHLILQLHSQLELQILQLLFLLQLLVLSDNAVLMDYL